MASTQIVSCCSDGALLLWDITSKDGLPLLRYMGHDRSEIAACMWNTVHKCFFITASWDKTCAIWDVTRETAVHHLTGHTEAVFAVMGHPSDGTLYLSGSSDASVKVWDSRSASAVVSAHGHTTDVLSVEWNKYNPAIFLSGSADSTVAIWVHIFD